MENYDQPIERSAIYNESPLPTEVSNNHNNAKNSCPANQHTTLNDGAYMSHSESMSDVTVTMFYDHTCSSPATRVLSNASENAPVHFHIPTTGQYTFLFIYFYLLRLYSTSAEGLPVILMIIQWMQVLIMCHFALQKTLKIWRYLLQVTCSIISHKYEHACHTMLL